MSTIKRMISGVFTHFLCQLLVAICGFVVVPIYIEKIGKAEYGIWVIMLQFLTYVGLSSFGIGVLLPRELVKSIINNDNKTSKEIVQISLTLMTMYAFLGGLLTVLLIFFLPEKLKPYASHILAILCGYVISLPLSIFNCILIGAQDLVYVSLIKSLNQILLSVLSTIIVYYHSSLWAIVFAWYISYFLTLFLFFIRCWLAFPGLIPYRFGSLRNNLALSFLHSGFWITISSITLIFTGGLDYLFILLFSESAIIAVYSCSQKLLLTLCNQVSTVLNITTPAFSQFKTDTDPQKKKIAIIDVLTCQFVAVGLIVNVVMATNKGFIKIWVGDMSLYCGDLLMTLLCISAIIRSTWLLSIQLLTSFNHERVISIGNILDGLATAAAMYFLIKFFGIIGAPLGSIFGCILISCPLHLYFLSQEIQDFKIIIYRSLYLFVKLFLALSASIVIGNFVFCANCSILLSLLSTLLSCFFAIAIFFIFFYNTILNTILAQPLKDIFLHNKKIAYSIIIRISNKL